MKYPQDDDEPDVTTVTKLGHGPAISYMDRTSIGHIGLREHFVATAEREGYSSPIPFPTICRVAQMLARFISQLLAFPH